MDNTETRLNDVFFYGLYMDPELLKEKGVEPRNARKAVARGYRMCVGNMATLLREPNAEAYGLVYSITHDELDKLYWGAGLNAYVAESLLVETDGNEKVAALCCNLLVPPKEEERNPEYLGKLVQCMNKLGLPAPSV